MNTGPNNKYLADNVSLIRTALILILALSLFVFISMYISRGVRTNDQNILVDEKVFPEMQLIARSAIVYDMLDGKVIYSKNPDDVYPLASIAKVLTMVTAVELLPRASEITIKNEFLEAEGDSGLLKDERWKLSDLIGYSLMVSSNDGANAIASVAGAFLTKSDPSSVTREGFIVDMNKKAKEIGMERSIFYNESGLDLSLERSGSYGTARDVATLFSYALKEHPEILSATTYQNLTFTSISNISHRAQNTDTVLGLIPAVLGSKTGYTALAGGNLAIAFEPSFGRPVAIVVLGSTYDGRFEDMQKLVRNTMKLTSQR